MPKTSKFIIFTLLVLSVVISQVILLKPIVGQGLTPEDYVGFFSIRVSKDTMFSDPINYWRQMGMHNTAHNLYLGFQDILFRDNYNMYLYSDIFFKIVATLLLYPLILIITNNKLLAFLGTFLYGISYSTAGTLYLYVVGNEYLGIALIYIFLISYYFCLKQTNLQTLLYSSLLISLSFFALPIRIFPIFIIILLIESYLLIKNKLSKITPTLLRIVSIFFPIAVIMLYSLIRVGTSEYELEIIPSFLSRISNGNWYLLLYPLWGLGYTYLPANYFHIFGKIDFSNYISYLISLSHVSFTIFVPVSLLLSFIISNKRIRFFLVLMFINILLDSVLFILYTHHFSIPENLRFGYSVPTFIDGLYAGICANFVISIASACGIEWYLTNRKNRVLFIVFVSPFFSLLFIVGQWAFTRDYRMYQEGILRYFVIPALGSYLFVAGILTLIYQRTKSYKRSLALLLIIFVIFQIFNISRKEIAQVFDGKKRDGRDLQIQESIKSQTLNYILIDKLENNMLIYFKLTSPIPEVSNLQENTFDWRYLSHWVLINKSYLLNKAVDGCAAVTWDFSELQKMASTNNGSKVFLYSNGPYKEIRCAHKGIVYYLDKETINLDDFYAFRIDDNYKVIDITNEVKGNLTF